MKSLLILMLLASACATAQTTLHVNVNAPKKAVAPHPAGVNLFMLMDHDDAQPRTVPMWRAMRDLGVRSVRFNEGEYGDWYLFTHPDSTYLLDRPGAKLYPYLIDIKSKGIDSQLTDIKAAPSCPGYPLNRPGFRRTVDFNDFIEMCRKADAPDPTIIIPTHPMDWDKAKPWYPTREQMVRMAAEWVRYANVTCRLGYRFWEIGNEHYWENNNDAQDTLWARKCAGLALEMAKAMKAVDPSIEIGVNGFTEPWLRTLLQYEDANGRLIDYVDNIVPHQYAKQELIGTYEKYLRSKEYGLHEVDEALKAINERTLPDAAKRAAMKVEVTEASSFMAGEPALKVDNVAWVALANFEHLGYILAAPRVEYVHFWATHWTDDKTYWSALKMDNTIAPMGWGVKLWNDYLLDDLWKADLHDTTLRCYATSSADGRRLNLLVVNRGKAATSCKVEIAGFTPVGSAPVHSLWAASPESRDFTFEKQSPVKPAATGLELQLRPLSVTIVEMKGR